jgi:hypothetical protein
LHHLYQKSIKFSSLGFKAWLLDANLRCLSLVLELEVSQLWTNYSPWLAAAAAAAAQTEADLVMGVGYVVLEEEKEGVFSR